MTAWVVSVLLMPATMPEATTQTITAQRLPVKMPISRIRTANALSAP